MGKGWVLETFIILAGGLEIAMGPPVALRTAFILVVGTGTWGDRGPRRKLPGGQRSALGSGGSGREQDKNSKKEGSLGWEAGRTWVSHASSWLCDPGQVPSPLCETGG